MNLRPDAKAALTALLVLTLAGSVGAAGRVSVGGYFKSYFVAYEPPTLSTRGGIDPSRVQLDPPSLGSVSNRLRLNLRIRPAGWLDLDAAYDFAPRVQDPILFAGETLVETIAPAGSYRCDDVTSILYPSHYRDISSFAIYQNLDRLSATVHAPKFDLIVGRQSIAWGTARVINPTDILAPYAYSQLDVEDRVGVDAVRLRIPLGFMGEIDAGYVVGEDWESDRSAVLGRVKLYAAETDFSLIACRFREHLLFGGDLARSVGGAGVWLEAAEVLVDTPDDGSPGEDYFRLSMGADYNFADGLYGFAEYHFNGAGMSDPGDYSSLYNAPAYVDGATYLLGKHYITPGVSYQVTPLLTATGEALINLSDGSALAAPSLEYNLSQNVYLQVGGYFAIGKRPEIGEGDTVRPSPERILQSEFGSYPHEIYSSFRVYF